MEKNGVVIDKLCPKCKKPVLSENQLCKCGFRTKSLKNNSFALFFGASALVTSLLLGTLIVNIHPHKDKKTSGAQEQKLDFDSLSPVNVQVISSLKDYPFRSLVQNVYVKPDKDEHLVILINPSLWSRLKKEEKSVIFNTIDKNWQKIYKKRNPNSAKKTSVSFANPE